MLTNPTTVIFQIVAALEQNMNKLLRSLAFGAMLFFETMPVKLYGTSHPASKVCKDGLPYGSQALSVSRVEGVQGFLARFMASKV